MSENVAKLARAFVGELRGTDLDVLSERQLGLLHDLAKAISPALAESVGIYLQSRRDRTAAIHNEYAATGGNE